MKQKKVRIMLTGSDSTRDELMLIPRDGAAKGGLDLLTLIINYSSVLSIWAQATVIWATLQLRFYLLR